MATLESDSDRRLRMALKRIQPKKNYVSKNIPNHTFKIPRVFNEGDEVSYNFKYYFIKTIVEFPNGEKKAHLMDSTGDIIHRNIIFDDIVKRRNFS